MKSSNNDSQLPNITLPKYNPIGKVYNYGQLEDFIIDPDVLVGMTTFVKL